MRSFRLPSITVAVTTGLVATSCGRLQATDDGWFLLDEAVRRLAPGV